MRTFIRRAGVALLVLVLVFSLAACGQKTTPVTTDDTVKEVVVETAPPSPTPTPTPEVSVPPVAVTTVPMPMPSVTPTVSVTAPEGADASSATATAQPTVSPSPTATANANANNDNYSPAAAFASTIKPDSVNKPANSVRGYIIGNDVNFRAGPSASARLLGTYDSGTPVEIIGSEYGWTEVIINGVAGYVKNEYVSAGTYGSSNSVVVGGSGNTMVIVPDGPAGSVVNSGDGDNFLGILPD